MAPTIRARRGNVPIVKMGGNKRLRAGERQTVGDIWAGAEFGGGRRPTTHQFKPYIPSPTGKGGAGYFFFPAIRDMEADIVERYGDALGKALRKVH